MRDLTKLPNENITPDMVARWRDSIVFLLGPCRKRLSDSERVKLINLKDQLEKAGSISWNQSLNLRKLYNKMSQRMG